MQTTTASKLGTTKRTFWTIAREQLETEKAVKVASAKTYKSQRAAQMAYNKADRLAQDAKSAVVAKNVEFRQDGWNQERFAIVAALEAFEQKCWDEAFAIYSSARKQGFYVKSRKFDYNSTRELIAANMD